MNSFWLSKIWGMSITVAMALSATACVEEAAIQQPDVGAPRAARRTISPQVASLSDPVVATGRTAKDYYLDLERCRGYVANSMGGTGSDDVAALRRALARQTDGSKVVVRYEGADRAVVRDLAVKACLVRKGYTVKL